MKSPRRTRTAATYAEEYDMSKSGKGRKTKGKCKGKCKGKGELAELRKEVRDLRKAIEKLSGAVAVVRNELPPDSLVLVPLPEGDGEQIDPSPTGVAADEVVPDAPVDDAAESATDL